MALVSPCSDAASMIGGIRVADLAIASCGRIIAALNGTIGVVGRLRSIRVRILSLRCVGMQIRRRCRKRDVLIDIGS